MLLIYAPYKTNRLTYVLDFIFNEVCSVNYSFTFSKSDFDMYAGAKIAYTSEAQTSGVWMYNSGLLFENEIKTTMPQAMTTEWGKVMYSSMNNKSIAPFDVFSAVFWLISRYEEYVILDKDNHDRFDYQSSWAFKNGLLQIPIVDVWIKKLIEKLQALYPELNIKFKPYRFIVTFDIDNFFAFKGKGFLRSFLATAHALGKRRFDLLMLRLSFLLNSKDPYDTYNYILSICKQENLNPYFFILTGKTSGMDRNISANHSLFIKTSQKLKQYGKIGIHLSYNATGKNSAEAEKHMLEEIIGMDVFFNRFHFLRFSMPQSYQMLINGGIKEDYSMAYTAIDGYRAGTCTPFYFYDLQNDKATDLLIYPMPFIDRTLIDSLKLNIYEAKEKINQYISQIKENNGVFVSLWHNETLQNNKYWQEWRHVFEWMINIVSK